MTPLDILIAIVIGTVVAFFHSLALRVATRLMVNVPVLFRRALSIVLLEYMAVLLIGMILFLVLKSQTFTLVIGSLTYLFTGAVLIDLWINTKEGHRLGIGNGVLIQAIQIPILVPLIIIAWLLYDILI
ncbi:MAG: hypothetical protein HY356_00845 [Gammaproteobacteria bacterium]|nr:hypothetical protein [Gammaproteobacteria bacterium]